jgi:hypothetical protein
MLEAIICGTKSGATKTVNYNKIKGIIQRQEENPVAFMIDRRNPNILPLILSLLKGDALLNHHFVNQSTSNIR